MLQPYGAPQPLYADDSPGRTFDVLALLGVLRRRLAYFIIPFVLVLMSGSGIVAIQRPIYRAEGKILVQSPEIPPDLVRPTITEVADERIQVIQQRLLARDNLLAIVNKYNLFPRERAWMSGTELLDMMRQRVEIKPIALDTQYISRPSNPAIAFTLTFDYEVPELAMRVANDFLTSILSEDASTRNNNASGTRKFLEIEVKRLEAEHDSVITQIAAAKQQPPDPQQADSEELKGKTAQLAKLETELTEKSSVYSSEYPAVKRLRRQIAALKHDIASTPRPAAVTAKEIRPDVATEVLEQHRLELERDLADANRKLTIARMGETMERDEQGERLQVIEQPTLPQVPVRPKRIKWLAAAFVAAAVIASGFVVMAEMFDTTIRGSSEFAAVIDRHLIVNIPYIASPGEERRRRAKLILICLALVAALAAGIFFAVIHGITVDFFVLDRSWIDPLTHLLR